MVTSAVARDSQVDTIFLKEKVSAGQWLGIALIFGGVAAMSVSNA